MVVRQHGGMARKLSRIGTFGSHVQHFARSVDIVDSGTFDRTRQLVHDYLQEQFDAKYFELSIEHEVNGSPGLRTFWNSEKREFSTHIWNTDGTYTSQAARCYGEKKSLWVVDDEKKSLHTGNNDRAVSSNISGRPPYRPPGDHTPIFTSVLIPICRPNGRILGVMNVDS